MPTSHIISKMFKMTLIKQWTVIILSLSFTKVFFSSAVPLISLWFLCIENFFCWFHIPELWPGAGGQRCCNLTDLPVATFMLCCKTLKPNKVHSNFSWSSQSFQRYQHCKKKKKGIVNFGEICTELCTGHSRWIQRHTEYFHLVKSQQCLTALSVIIKSSCTLSRQFTK